MLGQFSDYHRWDEGPIDVAIADGIDEAFCGWWGPWESIYGNTTKIRRDQERIRKSRDLGGVGDYFVFSISSGTWWTYMKGGQSHEELSRHDVSIDIHITLRCWK